MTTNLDILPQSSIRGEISRRRSPYVREKIPVARQSEYEADGWILDKQLKGHIWMRQPKRHDIAFEDRVWAMCALLGFQHLSKNRSLRICYGRQDNESKQIDVLAADEEVVLVIECKSSDAHQ